VSTAIEPLRASSSLVPAEALAPALAEGDGASPEGTDEGVPGLGDGVGPPHATTIAATAMAAMPLSHLIT
jgi:hypothetical protein